MKKSTFILSMFALLLPALAWAYPGEAPRTGQTISYAVGDDSDIQAGVVWSDPRFKDNGDGTVTDKLTGLVSGASNANLLVTVAAGADPTIDISNPVYSECGWVTINGAVSGDTFGPPIWDWGDGTTTLSWSPASHRYRANGTYTVLVTALGCSSSASASKSVIITNAEDPGCLVSSCRYLFPYNLHLVAGQTTAAPLQFRDQSGNPVTGVTEFYPGDPTLVSISADGYVTALRTEDNTTEIGTWISAKLDGNWVANACVARVLPTDYGVEFSEVVGEHTALYYPSSIEGEDLDALVDLYQMSTVNDYAYEIQNDLLGVQPFGGCRQIIEVDLGVSDTNGPCGLSGNPVRLGWNIEGGVWANCFLVPFLLPRAPQWGVIFHEIGHNFTWSIPSFGSALGIFNYSEGMATAMALADLACIVGDEPSYPIDNLTRESLLKIYDFNPTQGFFAARQNWLNSGADFSLLNPDIVDGIWLYHAGPNVPCFARRFFLPLQPKNFAAIGSVLCNVATEDDKHTFFAALVSAAAGKDLSALFTNTYNYPIDQTLFNKAYSTFSAIIGCTYSDGDCNGPTEETCKTTSSTTTVPAFIDNGDGTVTDPRTGLMWQQETAPGTYTWEQALVYCESRELAGYTDWRLPTAKELGSLTDTRRRFPPVNTIYFPGTMVSEYWASTTSAGYTGYAWLVNFGWGDVYHSLKSNSYYVRAVRSGHAGSFDNLTLWPVPDTGQTQSYTGTFGEDHDYTINQPSYTKLASGCTPLPDNATTWAMVRDEVTGLIWEEKHAKDGMQYYTDPNDADNTYTWYDNNSGQPGDGTDTVDFIMALNTANYGGYSDWRMPTIKELQSIVDYSRYEKTINTTYFPDTVASIYWSSTTLAGYTGYAWLVDFYSGGVGMGYETGYSYVRAVRSGQCGPFADLVISKSGTGAGTVTSGDEKINCGNDCTEAYTQGTEVTLTATIAAGSAFAGWSGGGCSGMGNCTVTMIEDTEIIASFIEEPTTTTTSVVPTTTTTSVEPTTTTTQSTTTTTQPTTTTTQPTTTTSQPTTATTSVEPTTTTTSVVPTTSTTSVVPTTTTTSVPTTTTTQLTTTTTAEQTTTSTSIQPTTTTTTAITPCAVKLFPASISKLVSLILPIRFFVISGEKGAEFTKDTAVVWDAEGIKTINKFVLGRQNKFLLVQVFIQSQFLEASELYTVKVGDCFGTLKVRAF